MITQRKLFSHSDLISEVIIERLEPRLGTWYKPPVYFAEIPG